MCNAGVERRPRTMRKSPPAESPPKAESGEAGRGGQGAGKFVMKRFQNAKARVVMGSVQNGADAKASRPGAGLRQSRQNPCLRRRTKVVSVKRKMRDTRDYMNEHMLTHILKFFYAGAQ